ncbi:MAG: hypothetical protein CMO42_09300 [Verrucomicrobiales bacterium]|nr:hypothetical protein [Verrucomicrobiales bacterium]
MLGALLSDNTPQRFKFISFPRQKPPLKPMKYYHYLFAILILGAISCSKKDVEENNSAQSTTQTQASTDADLNLVLNQNQILIVLRPQNPTNQQRMKIMILANIQKQQKA